MRYCSVVANGVVLYPAKKHKRCNGARLFGDSEYESRARCGTTLDAGIEGRTKRYDGQGEGRHGHSRTYVSDGRGLAVNGVSSAA